MDFAQLLRLRDALGPHYGSEDLCLLFYSLIRREKPAVMVELGTGLGICSVWMAQAAKENGHGHVYTLDDGRQFAGMAKVLRQNAEALGDLFALPELQTYDAYLAALFADHAAQVTVRNASFALDGDALLTPQAADFGGKAVDLLFTDFAHDPHAIMDILAFFLPRMAECASIFIDSASTSKTSYAMLERLVAQLNANKIPRRFLNAGPQRDALCELVPKRQFRLMHLVERKLRAQNGTAWLRIEPVDWQPHPLTQMH